MPQGELFAWVYQGGFAVLAVWLIWDSRKAEVRRETQAREREQALTTLLPTFSDKLPDMAQALQQIDQRLERVEARGAKSSAEHAQIMGLVGDRRRDASWGLHDSG